MQITRQKESAALLAGQQLLAEEEQEKMRLAAKVARKQQAKAKKQQPQEQQPQQDIIQAEADLDSVADSDCLKAPTAAIETAAPESADPLIVDDDWSVSDAPGLSAKQGWKAALGVDMVNRTTAVRGSSQGRGRTPLDSVIAAPAQLASRPQPRAKPSVTPEVHAPLPDSKGDQTMMDLFLCPITKVVYCGLSCAWHSCCNNRTSCLHTEMSCLPLSWLCLAGGHCQLYQLLVAMRFSVITCSGIDEGPCHCC